jgi:uncharacterized protein (DUF362 family)/Pyruvate/2-oxoacid:ferredoxin oxidoreductase delta subunit
VVDNRVFVVQCADYDQVDGKLEELLHMMGGVDRFVAPGESIALKVNLLMAAEPERAITTHPQLVAAVGREVKKLSAIPFIVDSPTGGYAYTEGTMKRVYRETRMTDAAAEAGIALSFDTTHQPVSFLEGQLTKRFDMLTPLVEADGVLNLCKLKTHTYMAMTGAIKNTFGAIPGRAKAGYHGKLADAGRFAQMLLDLSACVAPRLSIMDAIVGMEGDGPNSGTPRHIGLLLASTNPLALDVVAGEIIGLARARNPVLVEAEKRGLRPTRLEDVEVIGAEIGDLRVPDFELPATLAGGMGVTGASWLARIARPLFRPALTLRPRVIEDTCIACGACRDICPEQVITIRRNGRRRCAHINDDGCIRCYCCHETCPEDAIELRGGLLYRLLNR